MYPRHISCAMYAHRITHIGSLHAHAHAHTRTHTHTHTHTQICLNPSRKKTGGNIPASPFQSTSTASDKSE